MALGILSLLAVAGIEVLTTRIEARSERLRELIRMEDEEIAAWKHNIRLLSGVVGILRQDSEDLKRGKLVGEIDLCVRPANARRSLIEAEPMELLPAGRAATPASTQRVILPDAKGIPDV